MIDDKLIKLTIRKRGRAELLSQAIYQLLFLYDHSFLCSYINIPLTPMLTIGVVSIC